MIEYVVVRLAKYGGKHNIIGASLSEPHTSESFGTINHVQTNTEISD